MSDTSGIKPIGEQVLILPDAVNQYSESGLQIMSDAELERQELGQTEGVVLKLSSSYKEVPEFKVGDTIIFAKYSGLLLDGLDGVRYRLVEKKDVKGVYVENENG